MTLDEMINMMVEEVTNQCKEDESKFKVFEEFTSLIEPALKNGEKIDGCELFKVCDKLNREFPDFVSAVMAMSVIASFGVQANLVEFDNVTSLNLGDVIEGADIDDGEG